MKNFLKLAAAALFTVSIAGAAHAGGFGWGAGGHYSSHHYTRNDSSSRSNSSGGLLNLSPTVRLGDVGLLDGNTTNLLSGILNGNSTLNGSGVLNNLLGGNRYSVRSGSHSRHRHHRW